MYVSRADDGLLPPAAMNVVGKVLKGLQFDRKAQKGNRPVRRLSRFATSTAAPRRAGRGSPNEETDGEAAEGSVGVARCLAQACQADTAADAGVILTGFLDSDTSDVASPSVRCLVGAALAELVFACGSSSSSGGGSGASPATVEMEAEALSRLDDAVAQGHVGAMLRVGLCLRDGRGIPADLAASLTWIERAAQAGYCPAMFELAEMLEHGVTVEGDVLDEDWGAALQWYTRAARRGHAPSQLNAAKLLLAASADSEDSKVTTEADRAALRERAGEWLSQASASGSEEAMRLRQRLGLDE